MKTATDLADPIAAAAAAAVLNSVIHPRTLQVGDVKLCVQYQPPSKTLSWLTRTPVTIRTSPLTPFGKFVSSWNSV